MRLKIDLEIPSWTKWLVGGIAIGAVLGVGAARVYADTISVKTSWAAGEVLKAADINSNFKTLQDAVNSAAPPGTISAYFGATPPAGWLQADGTMIDSQSMPQYSALVILLRSLGVAYQGAAATQAKLPDLRGMFLRGAGTNAVQTSATGTGFAGNIVGTYQQEQMQGHRHNTADFSPGNSQYAGAHLMMSSGSTGFWGLFFQNGDAPVTTGSPVADGANGAPRLGNETKPASVSVAYVIKY
jgi:microcystin-dependent protein